MLPYFHIMPLNVMINAKKFSTDEVDSDKANELWCRVRVALSEGQKVDLGTAVPTMASALMASKEFQI